MHQSRKLKITNPAKLFPFIKGHAKKENNSHVKFQKSACPSPSSSFLIEQFLQDNFIINKDDIQILVKNPINEGKQVS